MPRKPVLRLYEPPLDTGDGDDDEPEIPPAALQACFFVCLILGSTIAAVIWAVAACFVP